MSWELPCQFYMIQHTTVGSWISVLLEDTVSILDLSVLVLADNFCLKCHSGNPSFQHLLEHDLLILVFL